MKVSLLILVLLTTKASAQGYGAPPPPVVAETTVAPEGGDPVVEETPAPPMDITTAADPCEPVAADVPEECITTDGDTGCAVAVPDCPAPPPPPEATVVPGPGYDATEAPADEVTEATAEEATPGGGVGEGVTQPAPDATEATAEEATPGGSVGEGVTQPAPDATEAPAAEGSTAALTGEDATEAPAGNDPVQPETEQSSSTTDELPESGMDVHEYCCWWAQEGECDTNLFWMRPRCQKSCGTTDCTVDNAASCAVTLNVGDCQWQREGGLEPTEQILEPPPVPAEGCENQHRLCNFWAKGNQCEENATWMSANCPVSCGTC